MVMEMKMEIKVMVQVKLRIQEKAWIRKKKMKNMEQIETWKRRRK